MDFLYRIADSADLPALLQVENQAFTGDRLSQRSFRTLLQRQSARVVVAEAAEGLLGYALVLFRRNTHVARLYSLAITPGARGLGLGAGLLEQAERCAHDRACRALRLEVRVDNVAAIGLYERRGYRRFGSHTGYYADGADAWRYEKALPAS
ncbi:GNAT family N-acetyltransferase [Pseudomonas knackmussii]|uniref:GNAT family N-acetyltransferase n=1 Tax=Pseudomonas knackmussii TaxID=65741 RepID=UPI003BD65BA3